MIICSTLMKGKKLNVTQGARARRTQRRGTKCQGASMLSAKAQCMVDRPKEADASADASGAAVASTCHRIARLCQRTASASFAQQRAAARFCQRAGEGNRPQARALAVPLFRGYVGVAAVVTAVQGKQRKRKKIAEVAVLKTYRQQH